MFISCLVKKFELSGFTIDSHKLEMLSKHSKDLYLDSNCKICQSSKGVLISCEVPTCEEQFHPICAYLVRQM